MLSHLSVQDHMINDFGKFVILPFDEKRDKIVRPTPIVFVPERKKEFVLLRGNTRSSIIEEKLPREMPQQTPMFQSIPSTRAVSFLDVEKIQETEIELSLQKKQEPGILLHQEKIKEKEDQVYSKVTCEKKKYLACQKVDCKYGSKCIFAHAFGDFEPSLCKFDKKCKNGNNCTFKHSSETKKEFVFRRNIKFICF